MLTDAQRTALIELAVKETKRRYTFPAVGELILEPTPDQWAAAVEDAMSEISTVVRASGGSDPLAIIMGTLDSQSRLIRPSDVTLAPLLYIATAKHIAMQLAITWTTRGFGISISDFEFEDKTAKYNDLVTSLTAELDRRLEDKRLQMEYRSTGFKNTMPNPITNSSSISRMSRVRRVR